MSVLIRGMKMPETCSDCELYQYGFCMVTRNVCDKALAQRRDDCPLVEVPPHGRLVDGDVLMTEVMDSDLDHLQRDDWKEVIQIVADAPTIIEAEGSDNG